MSLVSAHVPYRKIRKSLHHVEIASYHIRLVQLRSMWCKLENTDRYMIPCM
jgi:hypothetical protein